MDQHRGTTCGCCGYRRTGGRRDSDRSLRDWRGCHWAGSGGRNFTFRPVARPVVDRCRIARLEGAGPVRRGAVRLGCCRRGMVCMRCSRHRRLRMGRLYGLGIQAGGNLRTTVVRPAAENREIAIPELAEGGPRPIGKKPPFPRSLNQPARRAMRTGSREVLRSRTPMAVATAAKPMASASQNP